MKYLYGFTIGMLCEYLIRVEFDIYALIALMLIIIGVIIREINEAKFFKNKN
jgi:hypothetical protein